jgi:uncharacterized membrane protein YhaH (DUF805 family)
MNFPQAIASGFKKYFTFSGRASRSEYWYWFVFATLAQVVFSLLDATIFKAPLSQTGVLERLWQLVTLTPTIGVAVRRLHDVDRTGWWLLLELTIIGIFFPLLVWNCLKGTNGANRFGPDPLGAEDTRVVQVFS